MGEYEGNVRHEDLNLQWLGLLFAIMTGSITCAPSSIYRSWGFSSEERMVLSQRWYEATVTCLEVAGYIETHTIHSRQVEQPVNTACISWSHRSEPRSTPPWTRERSWGYFKGAAAST